MNANQIYTCAIVQGPVHRPKMGADIKNCVQAIFGGILGVPCLVRVAVRVGFRNQLQGPSLEKHGDGEETIYEEWKINI